MYPLILFDVHQDVGHPIGNAVSFFSARNGNSAESYCPGLEGWPFIPKAERMLDQCWISYLCEVVWKG